MLLHRFIRNIHVSSAFASVQKSALAALRKKTGYTFANCKKALELHNNDINLAEKWLNEQAQSLGWSKATKLADRVTAQGLIGVLIRGNIGAMVEVNCETDFVARNDNFRNFVDYAAKICAQYTAQTEFDGDLWKLGFEAEVLKNLRTDDGKKLSDHLALLIGNVGENASLKRAICFKTGNDLQLSGYAHPAPVNEESIENVTYFGKYGTIAAIRGNLPIDDELKKNLCQHIVGMNPKKVGEFGRDEPLANKDDEVCLIHQEFLVDSDRTVGEILTENGINIIDYQRFECGESVRNEELAQAALGN